MAINRAFFRPKGLYLIASFLLATFSLNTAHANPPGDLSVGVCQRDITPVTASLAAAYEATFGEAKAVNHTDPVFMAGFGNDRRATGYNDRLASWSTAGAAASRWWRWT